MNDAVERAINCIWDRYSEPLTLSCIAQSAILSKFHLCRVFSAETGVSPGRFLSAVRIYEAKRLLVTTSMHVTDIAFAVGYNSLGSFCNHLADSVGIAPGRFRRISRNGGIDPPGFPVPSPRGGVVTGTISLPDDYGMARVYIGAFPTAIVQYRPASATIVDISATGKLHPYRLEGVAQGRWYPCGGRGRHSRPRTVDPPRAGHGRPCPGAGHGGRGDQGRHFPACQALHGSADPACAARL